MYFPTWIDLKGADAVPETVHHCVSSLLVFLHVCSLSVSHRNRPAQFAVYTETVLPSSLSISHRNRPAQFTVYAETVLPSSLSIQKPS